MKAQLLRQVYDLQNELRWQQSLVEHFFDRNAVEKYPDPAQRLAAMREGHERAARDNWPAYRQRNEAASEKVLLAAKSWLESLHHTCKAVAWSMSMDEAEALKVYHRAAGRAGMDLNQFFDKLGELRQLAAQPVSRHSPLAGMERPSVPEQAPSQSPSRGMRM